MEVLSLEQRAELWRTKRERRSARSPRPASARRARAGIAGCTLDLETYLPGDLLPKSDIASMAHSLELRSPLLDHRVAELGLALPDALKRRGREGKIALRRAFADDSRRASLARQDRLRSFRSRLVPRRAAPLARECCSASRRARGWFQARRGRAAARRPRGGRADNGHRLWTLVMLELWQRAHVDEPVTAAVARAGAPPTRARFVCALPVAVLLHVRNAILSAYVEKSDLSPDVRRPRHVRFHSRRAFRLHAAALRLVPHPVYWIFGEPGGRSDSPDRVAVVTAWLVYEIGRRVLGLAAGLAGATIATLNPYLVSHNMHVNREIVDQVVAAASSCDADGRGAAVAKLATRLGASRPLDARQHAAHRPARPVRGLPRVPLPRARATALAGLSFSGRTVVVMPWWSATTSTSAASRSRPTARDVEGEQSAHLRAAPRRPVDRRRRPASAASARAGPDA